MRGKCPTAQCEDEAMPHSKSYAAKAALDLSAPRRIIEQYCIAIIAIAVALVVRVALASVLNGEASYLFFLPAILIASAFGGWGPGLFATIVGLLLGLFFVADFRTASSADVVNAIVFTLVGVGASWRGELLRRSRLAAAANAEAALAREAHVKSILDSIPDAMIVIDDRGIMQSFSSAAERLFGHASADVVGANVRMLMPSPYRENHDGYLGRYLSTGERRIIGIGRVVDRRTQGRLDLPHGARRRRNARGQSALLHRVHPRSYRTPADRSEAAGIAGRARAYVAFDRHGRNGVRAGP